MKIFVLFFRCMDDSVLFSMYLFFSMLAIYYLLIIIIAILMIYNILFYRLVFGKKKSIIVKLIAFFTIMSFIYYMYNLSRNMWICCDRYEYLLNTQYSHYRVINWVILLLIIVQIGNLVREAH